MASMFNKFIKRTTAGILAMTVVLGTNAAVCGENFKSNGNYPVANAADSLVYVVSAAALPTALLSRSILLSISF